jgi:hypothetical protein
VEQFTISDASINHFSSEMSFRTFGHLLRYGEPPLRRAVPLAIALTSISNPQMSIIDTLSKFSHDSDAEVAYNCNKNVYLHSLIFFY